MDRNALLQYWEDPNDGCNTVESFLSVRSWRRSCLLAEVVENLISRESSVLELGAGVGRNLFLLWVLGYRNVFGVETSYTFSSVMHERFSVLASHWWNGTVEDFILKKPTADLVFTMAFFEHLHPDSEWVFDKIDSTWLITIEDEKTQSKRHFPRDYRDVFDKYDQIAKIKLGRLFPREFRGRVLRRTK